MRGSLATRSQPTTNDLAPPGRLWPEPPPQCHHDSHPAPPPDGPRLGRRVRGQLRTFHVPETWGWLLAATTDGRRFLSDIREGTAQLWEVTTGRCLRTFQGDEARWTKAAFAPDGQSFLTGGDCRGIRHWNTGSGRQIRQIPAEGSDHLESLYLAPGGRMAVAGSGRNVFRQ
jgi:WD40 repeat protein